MQSGLGAFAESRLVMTFSINVAGFELSMPKLCQIMWCQRNLILLFLQYKTLCKTQKNTCEFRIYCWDHVCKANEWYLVDCFHHKFRVSTQVMVCDYCIMKCKKFSTCSRLLIAFWDIFLWLKIFMLIWTLCGCYKNILQFQIHSRRKSKWRGILSHQD